MEEFSAEELREWEKDKRGEPFWEEIRRMSNRRIAGLRTAIQKGELNQAAILNGELNCCEEILQLVEIIIQTAVEEEKESEIN